MICFVKQTFMERIWRLISPSYRCRKDEELKQAIKTLMDNPSMPCQIEGTIIPNGYGGWGKGILFALLISIVLSVMPAQAQVRPILPFTLDPRQERGDIIIRDRQGNLTIGDYNNRSGDLFLFDTKTKHITTGTRDSFGDWTINEYKGFDHSGDDD